MCIALYYILTWRVKYICFELAVSMRKILDVRQKVSPINDAIETCANVAQKAVKKKPPAPGKKNEKGKKM